MTSDTKHRIAAAVAELGYRPNQAARHFRSGRSRFIALLVPTTANVFFGEMAFEVERRARLFGYSCLLCSVSEGDGTELLDSMLDMGVAGIVSAVSYMPPDTLGEFVLRGIPVVAVDEQHDSGLPETVDFVSIDHVANVQVALDHLVGLGHRAIAYVTDKGPSVFSRRTKLHAFREASERMNLQSCPSILTGSGGAASFVTALYAKIGEDAAEAIVRDWPDVTAAIMFSDFAAPGLIAGLKRRGMVVPRDFSVVGIDGIAMGEVLTPSLTSVREPLESIAEIAMQRLVDRIEKSTEPFERILVPPHLLFRETTAEVPVGREGRATPS